MDMSYHSGSGGGIGGQACAVALSAYPDIDVDIYEAATELSDVGASTGVWPRVWKFRRSSVIWLV